MMVTDVDHGWCQVPEHVKPNARSLSNDQVHLWSASLALGAARLRELTDLLAPDEHERALRFHFPRDRERFVAARGQLRIMLASYLGCSPKALVFSYGEHGKPALSAPCDARDLRFNLSHSGDLVLYLIALERAVGVDVEMVRPIPEMTAIVNHWFSEAERERFDALPAESNTRTFFMFWTRREALLKGRGEGISGMGGAGAASAGVGFPDADGWTVGSLEPAPNYVAAWAVEGGPVKLGCWRWGEAA